jgi:hypothetical protein
MGRMHLKHAKPPRTFAGELARRAGLRMVRFAVPTRDYEPIAKAKLRFGSAAVARLLTRLCRQVLSLCRGATHK